MTETTYDRRSNAQRGWDPVRKAPTFPMGARVRAAVPVAHGNDEIVVGKIVGIHDSYCESFISYMIHVPGRAVCHVHVSAHRVELEPEAPSEATFTTEISRSALKRMGADTIELSTSAGRRERAVTGDVVEIEGGGFAIFVGVSPAGVLWLTTSATKVGQQRATLARMWARTKRPSWQLPIGTNRGESAVRVGF